MFSPKGRKIKRIGEQTDMKRKHLLYAVVGGLAAAALAVPARADTIGGATVRTHDSGLNLRAGASTASDTLAVIPNGSFLLVEEALNGWYRVCYNGQGGYVSSDYAQFSEMLSGTYNYGAATGGTDVIMRAGASTSSEIVRQLSQRGSNVKITGVAGPWLMVKDNGGSAGYIRSDLIDYKRGTTDAPEAEPVPQSSLGEQIAAKALEYVGCRYTWGGMSPETGFDCSGFVNYIYNQFGYSLERVAQNIYYSSGRYVGWDELQPGDILCFGYSADSVGHVGLYIGNGQMVHASTYITGVIVTNLGDFGSFVGAKRLID